MIQRMLEEMEEGLNHDITVVARYKENYKEHGEEGTILQEEETDQIQLQVIDNIIYASLNDMYDVEIDLIKNMERRVRINLELLGGRFSRR